MFNRLIVGFDGGNSSYAAANYAFDLGAKWNLPVIGIYVIDKRLLDETLLEDLAGILGFTFYLGISQKVREALEKKADILFEEFAKLGRQKGAKVSLVQLEGIPYEEIPNFADREDLIFIGRKGLKEIKGFFVGNNAEKIVRRSPCPVFVAGENYKPIKRIGVAFDGSTVSKKALLVGKTISESIGAPLEVIFVEPNGNFPDQLVDKIKASADEILENTDYTFTLLRGFPEEKLTEYQENGNIDLLVLGAFGTKPVKEILLGSVAYFVMHNAVGPLLFVK
ncbi:MAG TPA: universal stress protein [Aquifex aeolicus]|uniref:Universal stress protein n=1 Tax=Aquifex aeolicus TaxID=63363 RepID=A0A9D1CEW7_AQUAO|nr:universal stress protein [Aquificales bacterium]HIP98305.1 universal stress protein [Aquifex aeolicus]HIQ26038.1 universal stress protein [Aquifex aeolicus]